jgi:hypothetical protein
VQPGLAGSSRPLQRQHVIVAVLFDRQSVAMLQLQLCSCCSAVSQAHVVEVTVGSLVLHCSASWQRRLPQVSNQVVQPKLVTLLQDLRRGCWLSSIVMDALHRHCSLRRCSRCNTRLRFNLPMIGRSTVLEGTVSGAAGCCKYCARALLVSLVCRPCTECCGRLQCVLPLNCRQTPVAAGCATFGRCSWPGSGGIFMVWRHLQCIY